MSHTKLRKYVLIFLLLTIFTRIASVQYDSEQSSLTATTPFNLKISALSINESKSISFLSDNDLDNYAFPGNGSAQNPWRFENYTFEIPFENTSSIGIYIENITEYLIIRNITITNTNTSVLGTGIKIIANNVQIENITINNVNDGIHFEGENLTLNTGNIDAQDFGIKATDCKSLFINGTKVTNSKYGIFLSECNEVLISENTFSRGKLGMQLYDCTNFRIEGNIIEENSEKGLLIVEVPPKSGSLNIITGNFFQLNGIHAFIISDELNSQFYDENTKTGNYWDDWRKWGNYKVQDDIYDIYPLGLDGEPASHYPFKFWFWIFAPIIVVLGAMGYFFYWKLIKQPTME